MTNYFRKPSFQGEVLVCEDDAINQKIICEYLGGYGLKTIIAANGKIGVDIVKERIKSGKKLFDLIFMDIHMPIMGGVEATAEIKELNPGVPIVALTANTIEIEREIYNHYGMSDCVGKPHTSQELWRCLMKHLAPVRLQVLNETKLNAYTSMNESVCQPADKAFAGPINIQDALKVFDKLEPLLEMGSPKSRELIGELRRMQENENVLITLLIKQIDDFDFEQAIFGLAELKKKFSVP